MTKYRHSFHAGNFADVHKHVTLLALLATLQRKEKGFLYLESHAGRGAYDLSTPTPEAAAGIGRFLTSPPVSDELRHYSQQIERLRQRLHSAHLYPGSPLLAAQQLRPQDRAVLIELLPTEARTLERALHAGAFAGGRMRVEEGDGFERLRAWLPPPERRGLTFIDPPYEQRQQDVARSTGAVLEALRRFPTGVLALWYPIKHGQDNSAWQAALARASECEMLLSELWLYPRDSRIALNGSGLLIVNPPYLLTERMKVWLPELLQALGAGPAGGTDVRSLSHGI